MSKITKRKMHVYYSNNLNELALAFEANGNMYFEAKGGWVVLARFAGGYDWAFIGAFE